MLKIVGQHEKDGNAAVGLVLVERNLRRLQAGQRVELAVGLELQNVNGGRRKTVVHLVIAYAETHAAGVEQMAASGAYEPEAIEKLRAWATRADAEGLDVGDHVVEPFDA